MHEPAEASVPRATHSRHSRPARHRRPIPDAWGKTAARSLVLAWRSGSTSATSRRAIPRWPRAAPRTMSSASSRTGSKSWARAHHRVPATPLVPFSQSDAGVQLGPRQNGDHVAGEARYLVGRDGGRSVIRQGRR